MKLSARSAIIWTVLAGTVAAAIFAPRGPSSDAVVGVVESAMKPAGAAPARADPDVVLELKPRDTRDLPIDSFSSTLWPAAAPAPAPAAAAPVVTEAAPTAVTAPPLPFRVLGRYIESGRATVFIQYNEKTVIATEGTLINDQYRVETINDTAMALTYLPLNERQILVLAGTP
jgi:hypothetical protein